MAGVGGHADRSHQASPLGIQPCQGIVPAGYAAFAFAAAATAGVLIGRTLPAMAAGLAAFAGARLAVRDWVRPHLMAPVRLSLPLNYGGGGGFRGTGGGGFIPLPGGPPLPGAWVYSIRAVDQASHTPTQKFLHRACPDTQGPGSLRGGAAPAPAGGRPGETAFSPFVLAVLRIEHGRLTDIAAFEQPSMFTAFGLPASL